MAPKTKTNVLDAGTFALNWAFDNELIPVSVTQGVGKYAGISKKRGFLTIEECLKLFTEGNWKDNYGAKLASLVAMQTGMRGGEILALKVKDVGEKLKVHKSFSVDDGRKSTKTGNDRNSPSVKFSPRSTTRICSYYPTPFQPLTLLIATWVDAKRKDFITSSVKEYLADNF